MTDYYIMEKFDPEQFVMDEVLTSTECIELLGITRARLSALIRKKKIVPIKKAGIQLYLKQDMLKKKAELEALRIKYRPWEHE
ncbi:DNA-binding protein [Peribacillus frigoritolerans]|uniref:DNA-binding protein n=1 Tax=Peribacillus frigoritolerans TaxID=450367 RepID=UPI002416B385|nr:DNA-binding protein [Peribacillus frigoritolerans]MDG4850517.1 DNA-binding protein [Peribacillus frigoritolerans]